MLGRPSLSSYAACLLVGLTITAAFAQAAWASQARLVGCGTGTCLRITGHRANSAVAIAVGGHALAVEGGRAWRATVPLATARSWAIPSGYSLTLTLTDAQGGAQSREVVILPPGALGRRVELAMLVVRPH